MSSSRRPWYRWYPKDFIADEKVQTLSADAELVYRRTLDLMWQATALRLPSNCLKLANALSKGLTSQEFEKAWSEIQTPGFELFKTTEDGAWIYSKRLTEEAERIGNVSKIRSELGKKGYQAKAQANAKQTSSHTDSDTDINTPLPPKGENGSCLKTFEYPGWLNKELWTDFHRMRSRIRKPITTTRTIAGLLKALQKLISEGYSQDEIIQTAIDKCWSSFFAPKPSGNPNQKSQETFTPKEFDYENLVHTDE